MTLSRARQQAVYAALFPTAIFVVNCWVAWRLFFTEYLDQMRSVEGEFIALARYIQHHWPGYDWFPMWNSGYPFARAYQPAAHYSVAVLAALTGLSTASAFHFLAALTYSLGGVAFYFLAKALSRDRNIAFAGALIFSLFSPSLLLLPAVRNDAGSLWFARRLQAVAVYGEFPNVTGLMLGMFGLALLHYALRRRSPASTLVAALAIATVPATNWPSTVALALALICYTAAFSWKEARASLPGMALIGAMACAFAIPFALPSTIAATFHNANGMSGQPTAGASRWISIALLLVCVVVMRSLVARAPFQIRFAMLYLNVLAWVVLSDAWYGVLILPQAMRFHLALEIAFVLTLVLAVQQLCLWSPRLQRPLALALALFCCTQLYHYRRSAHRMIHAIDITKTLEFQEATWFDRNMHGGRMLAPGTVQFWANVFSETPQMTGCCEQSVLTHQDIIAGYITQAGYRTDAESGKYALLWMKAFAVQAVALGGHDSREGYQDNRQFPDRYKGLLPQVWQSGDDYIYCVPERTAGLARVVHASDLVKDAPQNGIDAGELTSFVKALDDPSLPVAVMHWDGPDRAVIHAELQPSQVVSVAVNYHTGWTASSAGRSISVRPDGMGLIVLEPQCSGPCTIDMRWSPGIETKIVVPLALLTLLGSLAWCWTTRK